jgi:hypothetical protein
MKFESLALELHGHSPEALELRRRVRGRAFMQ